MFSKILVGFDGYGPARKAVERAVDLGEASGAEVLVLNAYQRHHPPVLGADTEPSTIERGQGLLNDVQKRFGHRATIRPLLKEGEPVDALLEVADKEAVDLIVVGSKGMTGRKRAVLASVPNQVSHHASCNVLIAHTIE